jgi:4-phytase/acid phosphatase
MKSHEMPRVPASPGVRAFAALAAALLLLAGPGAGLARADELRLAIVVTRHGVRSPLQAPEAMASLARDPWPEWETAPGIQTPHGNELVAQMGDYYRGRFVSEGALTGNPALDAPLVYLRADNDQRTLETARILGKSLAPVGEPLVNALPAGARDPLFRPYAAGVGHPDTALAVASILGRLGGDARAVDADFGAAFAELRAVLFPGGQPPGAAGATEILPGGPDYLVRVKGPLLEALNATDAIELEYADAKPMAQVGWGRVDADKLRDLLALHALFFDLTQRTRYPAQVGGSNLASHLVDTLEQAALGDSVPGALGPPGERVVVVAGHDTNIANLGGLFGMSWRVPGAGENPVLPAGALIFELWRREGPAGALYVRALYAAQTLEQMRQASPLGAANPPALSPIFIPGCSGSSPAFDAPLDSFVRKARLEIDRKFIAPDL